MKITKTENGYLLEDPQTSNEAQALEQFVESLREGNRKVEVNYKSANASTASQSRPSDGTHNTAGASG